MNLCAARAADARILPASQTGGEVALFITVGAALAVELAAAVVLVVMLGAFPFLVLSGAMLVVGAMIGWFSFRRLGMTAAWAFLVSLAAVASLIVESGAAQAPFSLEAVFEIAVYFTIPFVLVFLVPTLVGGLVTAVIRRHILRSP